MAKGIMIFDDSTRVREMVPSSIRQNDYEVIEAVDDQDAVSKLSIQTMDMLLNGLNIPNLDGIDLIKGVRSSTLNKFIPSSIMLRHES